MKEYPIYKMIDKVQIETCHECPALDRTLISCEELKKLGRDHEFDYVPRLRVHPRCPLNDVKRDPLTKYYQVDIIWGDTVLKSYPIKIHEIYEEDIETVIREEAWSLAEIASNQIEPDWKEISLEEWQKQTENSS